MVAAAQAMAASCNRHSDFVTRGLAGRGQQRRNAGNARPAAKSGTVGQKRAVAADLWQDENSDSVFFSQLYELLQRLSPARRRCAISTQLTEPQRRGLEAWILAHRSCGDEASLKTDSSAEDIARAEKKQKTTPKESACHVWHEAGPTGSVVTYSQRSRRTGRTSNWYYAVICMPGLHVLARMRRDRAAAVSDNEVLTRAKRQVAGATAAGRSFDEAARQAFLAGNVEGSRKRLPRAGGACSQPEQLFLRFYAAVELAGGGFRCLLRSPCCWDLEDALKARHRLLTALGDAQGQVPAKGPSPAASRLKSLPHRECEVVLERLRQEHQALHREKESSSAAKNFNRVASAVLEGRDASSSASLRRLLRHSASARRRETPQRGCWGVLKQSKSRNRGKFVQLTALKGFVNSKQTGARKPCGFILPSLRKAGLQP